MGKGQQIMGRAPGSIRTIRQRVLDDVDRITKSDLTPQPSATPDAESPPKVSESAEPGEDDEDDNPSGEETKARTKVAKTKATERAKGTESPNWPRNEPT